MQMMARDILFKNSILRMLVWATALCVNMIVQAATPYANEGSIGTYIGSESLSNLESGPGQKFSSSQSFLTLPLEHRRRRSEVFSSQFHIDSTRFDWRGTTAAEKEYIWLSMPIQYEQQRGRKNVFVINVEPGLMTDGGNVGIDHIGLNGSVVGRRLLANGGFWQLGLMVDRAFGDYDVRPVMTVGFQAAKHTWVELGFPEIQVKHHLSSALQSYFMIKPVGGVWKEEIKTATTQKDVSLQYSNWQMGVGADFHWRGAVWLSAEVGQLRNRRIHAYDETAVAVSATPGQSRYWRIGASIKY